jgi:hypothetical protein
MDKDKTERLVLRPLEKPVNREAFCDWVEDAYPKHYLITKNIRISLKGHRFNRVEAEKWSSGGTHIDVNVGYIWDGPSGPAINGETNVVGSLVHDIICTRKCGIYPLDGYTARHTLYVKINKMQGEGRARVWAHWLALMAGNWAYSWWHNRKRKK